MNDGRGGISGDRVGQTRIICGALIAGTVNLAGIIVLMDRTGSRPVRSPDAESLRTVYVFLVVVAAAGFLGSIALRRFLLGDRFRSAYRGDRLAAGLHFMRASVVCSALTESGAALGLVYSFLGGTFGDAILLVAIGFIGVANAVPRRWAYDDFVSGDGASGEDPTAQDNPGSQGGSSAWE